MKKTITCFAVASVLALSLTGVACSSDAGDSADKGQDSAVEYAEDSILAAHEARGTDISALTEVSIEGCTANGCHGGSWEDLVEENEAMWKGIGQIVDANPHASHASNAYECAECHSLEATSINQCNQCHVFESPEGWADPDKTTTPYGPGETEPMF